MNSLENLLGEICKVVLPIPEETFKGNSNSHIAICTLSSMDLLKKFRNAEILKNVSMVGRLLSENKGIDAILQYLNQNKKIKTLIVCGKDVWGHKAGHSLIKLYENGVDTNGRIIDSSSPDPFLNVPKTQIEYFRKEVNLINMINETNFEKIKKLI